MTMTIEGWDGWLAGPVLAWLLQATLGGSLLIGAALLLRFSLGRWLPVGALHLLGLIALLRLVLPAVQESRFSLLEIPGLAGVSGAVPDSSAPPLGDDGRLAGGLPAALTSVAAEGLEMPSPAGVESGGGEEASAGGDVVADASPAAPFVATPAAGPATPARVRSAVAAPAAAPGVWAAAEAPGHARTLRWVLFSAWVSGLFAVALHALWGYRRLRSWLGCQETLADPALRDEVEACRRRVGLSGPVDVAVVDRMRSAAVFGFFRPRILLPRELIAGLSPAELRHVILHELMHLRRRDPLVSAALLAVRCLHWFNPLVWVATRQLMADREVLCDGAVLACLGPSGRKPYGETLIRVAGLAALPARHGAAVIPLFRSQSETKRRLTMIASSKLNRRWQGRLGVSTAAAFALFGLTFAAAPADEGEKREGHEEGRERAEERNREGRAVEREHREHQERREGEVRERREGEVREHAERKHREGREATVRAMKAKIQRLADQGRRDQAAEAEHRLAELLEAWQREGRREGGRDRARGDGRRREGGPENAVPDRRREQDAWRAEEQELIERIHHLSELGRNEEANELERRVHDLRRLREREHPREREGEGGRFSEGRGPDERALLERIRRLSAEGRHEEANELERHVHELRARRDRGREPEGERRREGDFPRRGDGDRDNVRRGEREGDFDRRGDGDREREHPREIRRDRVEGEPRVRRARPDEAEALRHQVAELTAVVAEMRRAMEEMRAEIRRLREGHGERGERGREPQPPRGR